jgi:hypothetical protein
MKKITKVIQNIKCFFDYHRYDTLNNQISEHAKTLLQEHPEIAAANAMTLERKRCQNCPHIAFEEFKVSRLGILELLFSVVVVLSGVFSIFWIYLDL